MLRPLASALLLAALAAPAYAQHPAAGRPWPVVGTVAESFGRVGNHHLGVETFNPGVTISTESGGEVLAVAAGTVARVGILPEYGTFVIVQHGEYLTCYGNLSVVALREGDAVGLGQTVGRAGTAAQPKGAALFFAVFMGRNPVDPLAWLHAE